MPSYYDLALRKTERELNIESLPVAGRLPDWLQGTLIRNGPGTFEVGTDRYRHWFDGLAITRSSRLTWRGGLRRPGIKRAAIRASRSSSAGRGGHERMTACCCRSC